MRHLTLHAAALVWVSTVLVPQTPGARVAHRFAPSASRPLVPQSRPVSQRVTDAQDAADLAQSIQILAEFEKGLPLLDGEELIACLRRFPGIRQWDRRVAYYVRRDGNKLILKELARRRDSLLPVLRSHIDDHRAIFTGDNGEYETIGSVCRRICNGEEGGPMP